MIFNPRKWIEPHLMDALDSLRFELLTLRGRFFAPNRMPTLGRDYLHLGCYDTYLEGFLNTDSMLTHEAEVSLDARFPLRFDADTWTGIYAHHVVEHLAFGDCLSLFRECRRVLKKDGVFRMIVPDLETFLKLYNEGESSLRKRIFDLYPPHAIVGMDIITPLEMVDYVFRDHKFNRHLSSWDWETANARLIEAGFRKVIRQSVNHSEDPMLAGHDKPHWADFSLYVEAIK